MNCQTDPALDGCQPCDIDPTIDGCTEVEASRGVVTPVPVIDPAVEPAVEAVTPAPEVKDSTLVRPRTLPVTGAESQGVALFGFGLFVFGAGLAPSSRRRIRRLL